VSVTAPGSIGGRAEPFARHLGLRPGLITKRWPKSPSKASASWIPSFSITTKLRQSAALYSLSSYFFRY